MNATVTYYMDRIVNTWTGDGETAWFLVKLTKPDYGNPTHEPVAIFNSDSEAETFMGHIYAADSSLVGMPATMKEMFTRGLK